MGLRMLGALGPDISRRRALSVCMSLASCSLSLRTCHPLEEASPPAQHARMCAAALQRACLPTGGGCTAGGSWVHALPRRGSHSALCALPKAASFALHCCASCDSSAERCCKAGDAALCVTMCRRVSPTVCRAWRASRPNSCSPVEMAHLIPPS